MTQAFINSQAHSAWPFWVLELSPSAKNVDILKAANVISAKLELNSSGANKFITPDGIRTRDLFIVREAKAKLLDPASRLLAEFWYIEPTQDLEENRDHIKKTSDEWAAVFGVNF